MPFPMGHITRHRSDSRNAHIVEQTYIRFLASSPNCCLWEDNFATRPVPVTQGRCQHSCPTRTHNQGRPSPWTYEAFPLFQNNMFQKVQENIFLGHFPTKCLFIRQNFWWLFLVIHHEFQIFPFHDSQFCIPLFRKQFFIFSLPPCCWWCVYILALKFLPP